MLQHSHEHFIALRCDFRRRLTSGDEAACRLRASGNRGTAAVTDGGRLATALSSRGLFVAVHILHAGAPLGRGRGIQPHRGRPCRAAVPAILQALASGSVSLTTVRLLAPHLTDDNDRELLEAAHHKSKREIELVVATLNPKPPAATMIRKLPAAPVTVLATGTEKGDGGAIFTVEQLARSVGDHEPSAGAPALRSLESSRNSLDPPRTMVEIRTDHGPTGQPRTTISPLSSQHYKLQLTISRDTHDKLRRAQELFRHTMPRGDVAALLDRALTLLLADLERRRCAATPAPRATATRSGASRHIPAAVRRQVWQRDQGQCAFVGTSGRCRQTGFLEFHHVEP